MLKPFGYNIRMVEGYYPVPLQHRKRFDVFVVNSADFLSGNVIRAKSSVIAERENRSAIKELQGACLKVVALDLSEFIKGMGGPSCLVLPI